MVKESRFINFELLIKLSNILFFLEKRENERGWGERTRLLPESALEGSYRQELKPDIKTIHSDTVCVILTAMLNAHPSNTGFHKKNCDCLNSK